MFLSRIRTVSLLLENPLGITVQKQLSEHDTRATRDFAARPSNILLAQILCSPRIFKQNRDCCSLPQCLPNDMLATYSRLASAVNWTV